MCRRVGSVVVVVVVVGVVVVVVVVVASAFVEECEDVLFEQ